MCMPFSLWVSNKFFLKKRNCPHLKINIVAARRVANDGAGHASHSKSVLKREKIVGGFRLKYWFIK